MVIALCLGLTACGASAAGGKNEAETVMETAAAAGDTQGETVTEGGDSLTSPASLSSPQTAGRKLIRNVDLWAETEDFEGLLRSFRLCGAVRCFGQQHPARQPSLQAARLHHCPDPGRSAGLLSPGGGGPGQCN